MKHLFRTVIATGVLATGTLLVAQDKGQPQGQPQGQGQAERTAKSETTLAHVKEFDVGKKIVLDVENAIDKSYDLTKPDPDVKVAAGLKVGDAVKVTEQEIGGKKTVEIALDASAGKSGPAPEKR